MRGRVRTPSGVELALWRHAMRDVRRQGEAAADEPPPELPPPEPEPKEPPPRALRSLSKPPVASAAGPAEVDRRIFQRLQKGQYPISARLDLHGMTLDAAHAALTSFILREQARGTRCALIITGRGRHSEGVIKTMTPRWLDTPPLAGRVLGCTTARLAHGGDGALYVLLRRAR